MTRLGWLGIIGVLLLIGALKLTAPVSMAVLFAVFLAVLVFPLQCWLDSKLPTVIANGLAMLVVLAVVALFFGSVGFCLARLGQELPRLATSAEGLVESGLQWLRDSGVAAPPADQLWKDMNGQTTQMATSLVRQSGRTVQTVVLVTVFALLAQAEAPTVIRRLHQLPDDSRESALAIARDSASRLRHYMVVQTAMGVVTGILTALVCWLLSVEHAAVWGVLTFLLYYIPSVGHILATVPPTLMAFADQDAGRAALVLAILGGVQLVMGNFVDPALLGREQRVSVLTILLSVVFWGWVGGVVGAILGVPITLVLLVIANHFERTRWVAVIAGVHDGEQGVDAASRS